MSWNTAVRTCAFAGFVLGMVCRGNAEEPRQLSRFAISGPVAQKLADDVDVVIWSFAKGKSYAWRASEMPIAMPWERFVRLREETAHPYSVFVDFRDSKKERILSVLLSPDLFGEPRAIDVALKRPETFVRPAMIFGQFGFRYHALISRRMQYSALPRWDSESQSFLPPAQPVLKVYTAAEGELLQESEMQSMCYGFGWVAHADLPAELSDGTELRVVVTHDGGDLFGTLKTEYSFTYEREAYRTPSRR